MAMSIIKIDRKQLRENLLEILSNSTSFKLLSKDDEINPCRVLFAESEFYIYIKNLSPAQLSNNNPDIWRIQLPVRTDFNKLKESDSLFVVLGYDQSNDVYVTWNPYWVKQRLNVAKSVSLYSRYSLQRQAKESQLFLKRTLNNENEVIIFPCSKLGDYLANLKSFFPEISDYVALGSRKRISANTAYRCLSKVKNIEAFYKYLISEGNQSEVANSYCGIIRKLVSERYFSRNRRVFLACDTLEEYPNAIKVFLEIPEVKELNNRTHNVCSESLNAYIQYLIIYNKTGKASDSSTIVEEIDWEAMYTDPNGKLTCIANPKLVDLLRPVLNVEYRKLPSAYNIIDSFYGDRFRNTMELKDWNLLFNQINWQASETNTDDSKK